MKKLLSNLGLHKPDEMERHIVLRSRNTAYLYTTLVLLVWSLYESYQVYVSHTPLNLMPCFLLVTAVLVQSISQVILQRNAVKGETEYLESRPLFRVLLVGALLIAVAASVTAYFILSGGQP